MTSARARVLDLLRKHGWNATSFQVLEEGFEYAFDDECDACVAYVDTGRAWVVAGAPIASETECGGTVTRFVARARETRRRVAFFAVEDRFLKASRLASVHVGEQPTWDPTRWDEVLAGARSLREQLRRAQAKGVVARAAAATEIADGASPLRREVEALIGRWLASRGMAPMGFLVDVQPFAFAEERRYAVAERGGRLVAFLAAVPVYARGGWLIEDLVRDPTAPNGTAELLVDFTMRALAAEGSRYVTMGLAPLSGPVAGWLRVAREQTRALYDFDGVRAFKAKLRPHAWEAIHLAFEPGGPSTVALFDVLTAFARGSFARFGAETLLRGPAIVVRALGVLLVPWTALLAMAPARLFPFAWVQVAWVVFDAVLAAALFVLASRWRFWLGRAVAGIVALDAIVTCGEALAWNVPRARTPGDWCILGVACAAPIVASAILAGGVGHRARLEPERSAARHLH